MFSELVRALSYLKGEVEYLREQNVRDLLTRNKLLCIYLSVYNIVSDFFSQRHVTGELFCNFSTLHIDFSACRNGVCHVKRSVQDEAENQVQDNAAAPWREGMFINDILKNINKHLRFCIEEYYSIIIKS